MLMSLKGFKFSLPGATSYVANNSLSKTNPACTHMQVSDNIAIWRLTIVLYIDCIILRILTVL